MALWQHKHATNPREKKSRGEKMSQKKREMSVRHVDLDLSMILYRDISNEATNSLICLQKWDVIIGCTMKNFLVGENIVINYERNFYRRSQAGTFSLGWRNPKRVRNG